MSDKKNISPEQEEQLRRVMRRFDRLAWLLFFVFLLFFLYASNLIFLPFGNDTKPVATDSLAALEAQPDTANLIKDGIHLPSGLKVDTHYELVVANCGGCHSYKLVIQNNADSLGWTSTIRWMQKTQKLWDLGENEAKIVAYLSKNYGAKKISRRPPLKKQEWYKLE